MGETFDDKCSDEGACQIEDEVIDIEAAEGGEELDKLDGEEKQGGGKHTLGQAAKLFGKEGEENPEGDEEKQIAAEVDKGMAGCGGVGGEIGKVGDNGAEGDEIEAFRKGFEVGGIRRRRI